MNTPTHQPRVPGYVLVTAILTVGALMAYALHLGHDGVLLSGALFLIGALAGASVSPATQRLIKQPPASTVRRPRRKV